MARLFKKATRGSADASHPRLAIWFWSALAFLLGVGAARADTVGYGFHGIRVPGVEFTSATGINDAGQVVGYTLSSAGQTSGFLDTGGAFTTINVPGALLTAAYGINNSGQIAGTYLLPGASGSEGYLDTGGVFTSIAVGGASATQARADNAAGEVVGWYQVGGSQGEPLEVYGFVDSGGTITTLNVPGVTYITSADGINSQGDIVGFFSNSSGTAEGFLYEGGTFTPIQVPGAFATFALGINDSGEIVGYFQDSATGVAQGFLDDGGVFTTFELAKAATYPFSINNNGQIAGAVAGEGFVTTLQPGPEPGTLGLLALGSLALALWRRKAVSSQQ